MASLEKSDIIDQPTFNQLLEMDDDDEREFSKSIISNYIEQAETTFGQMETALQEKNLAQLSSLGHFLKGSSAAVGLIHVKSSCEKIQHFGAKKDETGSSDVSDEELCLERIKSTLKDVREQYQQACVYLRKFYDDKDL